jgi:hypothetical protein
MLLFMETVCARREQRPVALSAFLLTNKLSQSTHLFTSHRAEEKSHAAPLAKIVQALKYITAQIAFLGNYFGPSAHGKISPLLSYFFADGGRGGKFAQIEPLFFLKRRLTTALEKLKNKPFKVN